MKSPVGLAACLLMAAALSACVSIPGVTQPIPGRSPEEVARICADIQAQLAQPERYPGAHKAAQDALRGNKCPGA